MKDCLETRCLVERNGQFPPICTDFLNVAAIEANLEFMLQSSEAIDCLLLVFFLSICIRLTLILYIFMSGLI